MNDKNIVNQNPLEFKELKHLKKFAVRYYNKQRYITFVWTLYNFYSYHSFCKRPLTRKRMAKSTTQL